MQAKSIGLENGVIDVVGFEGKKSDRCQFIKETFDNVITNILKKNVNPIPSLTKAISNLEAGKVKPNLLKKSIKLGQNPKDYKSQSCQAAKIGAAVGAKKGELVEFFDSDIKKTGRSWSRNPRDIDISKYKQTLWNTVSEVLEIAGYNIEDLAMKFDVKTIKRKYNNNNTNGHKNVEPPRGVTGLR